MPNITLNTPGLDVTQTLEVEQARVVEAVSPTAEVERVEGGAKITVTDYQHETEAVVYDGEDAQDLLGLSVVNGMVCQTFEEVVA